MTVFKLDWKRGFGGMISWSIVFSVVIVVSVGCVCFCSFSLKEQPESSKLPISKITPKTLHRFLFFLRSFRIKSILLFAFMVILKL